MANVDTDSTSNQDDAFDERITFVVPSSSDFERITGFKNFTALWTTGPGADKSNNGHSNGIVGSSTGVLASVTGGDSVIDGSNNLSNLFGGLSNGNNDIHQILNYLWIGAVVSLIVLSLVFIVFSFYFYRKFVEWKKCNKDIQSQISNDLQQPYRTDDIYTKIESPPCYTIATGLPSYSEALLYSRYYEQLGYLWFPSSSSSEAWNSSSRQRQQQQQQQLQRQQLHQNDMIVTTTRISPVSMTVADSVTATAASIKRCLESPTVATTAVNNYASNNQSSGHDPVADKDEYVGIIVDRVYREVTATSQSCLEVSNLTDIVVLSS